VSSSVSKSFNAAVPDGLTDKAKARQRAKRPAPFSLRLTETQRARLVHEANGVPLGGYIKAKLLASPAVRTRRTSLTVEDRKSLAQVLALLGQSRLANNLNQLAHAANIGALPVTPDIEDELRAALFEVRDLRRLLLTALGFKSEASA
jgi:hypothetical protein